jgi:hypothetical protein
LPVAAQFHVERAAAAMLGVRRLEARNMGAEFRFVQPIGEKTAQASFALGSMKVLGAMQSVACKGRGTFAGYHENQAVAHGALLRQESKEAMPRHFSTNTMKVDACIDLHLATHQSLAGAAIERR